MKHHQLIKLPIVAILLVYCNILSAQVAGSAGSKGNDNILKINLPALLYKNISLQYERKVGRKSSFAIAVRYRPNTIIPFQKTVADVINDTSIKVDLFTVGNLGITPEYRFYLGKKGALRGFYIGPFISYNHYTSDVPVNYYDYVNNRSINKTADFKGSVNTFTAGFQLGAQWKLSEKIYFDWWIVGANYGFGNGDFLFAGALNDIEQISLRFKLEEIQQTIPLVKIEFPKGPPNANGATFKVKGPWAGIRAFGLNLGYRF